jgi:hypothetical protein
MPYSITTKDGITINNIPDNIAPDADELKQRVASIRAGGGAQAEPKTTAAGLAGAATRGLALPVTGAALGALAGAPIGGVGAIPGALAGAGTAAIIGIVGDPIVDTVNNLFGTKYQRPTEAMEDLLTRIGVAEPKTEAERIVQATAAGAAGAGGTVAAGRAIQTAAGQAAPVTREVGRMLGAQPISQIAGGAGAGAAGQAAKEQGMGAGVQIAASLAGGITGAAAPRAVQRLKQGPTIAQTPTTTPAQQLAQEDIEAAERAGVNLMTSDVVAPRTFPTKIIQTTGERIPLVGTAGVRRAQQEQRINAVRNVLREYEADDYAKLSENVLKDLATKRSADISKYSQAKNEVIDRLSEKGIVPLDNANKAIDEQITSLARRKSPAADEAIERLSEIKTNLQNRDLFQLEAYRRDELSKVFMDDPARPLSPAAREVGEKALRAVYDPVRQDMGAFIRQTGERRDFEKWMIANKRLAETAGDMKNASLKTVLLKGDATPEVIQRLLFNGKPSEVRALYSKLTPQGQSNARAAVLAKAADDSAIQAAEGKIVLPDQFARNVQKMGNSVGVLFKGDDLKRVEDLMRVLNITKRAREAAETPSTGVQAVPFVAGSLMTQLLGSAFAGASATAGIGLLARAYESAPVRNLLLKLRDAKPGSELESELARRVLSTVQTQAENIRQQSQPQQETE